MRHRNQSFRSPRVYCQTGARIVLDSMSWRFIAVKWKPLLQLFCIFCIAGTGLLAYAANWPPLQADGVHDPASPAVEILQEPAEALSVLPPDGVGNRVNWVKALQDGYIEPRHQLWQDTSTEVLDLDVVIKTAGSLPYVKFPHKPHTEWLACSNCHEDLFKSKAGATPITMLAILEGEYCGRCHGAIAFPLVDCARCHSVPIE